MKQRETKYTTISNARRTASLTVLFAFFALACCNRGDTPHNAPAPPRVTTPTAPSTDARPPADVITVRRVITLYQWNRTEPGNETTQHQSIEHGTPKLHLVVEVHRAPDNQGWITVGAIDGRVAIPENTRMRPLASTGTWHVPREGHTEFSLEQFGGELRSGEPIRVLLNSTPDTPVDLPVGPTPTMVKLPASGTLPATPRAAVGQYDAIVVFVVPVTSRRGGRYLLYALDLLPQPGGFAASGVMRHMPTSREIQRYLQWIRDPNGMARARKPPIPMHPIDW